MQDNSDAGSSLGNWNPTVAGVEDRDKRYKAVLLIMYGKNRHTEWWIYICRFVF